ncbi:MAG: hypothetical protein ACREID_04055, partial [Planctomycetota bacterium]
DLVVIAPDEAGGLRAGETALAFRGMLAERHGDLLGSTAEGRMVVVVFSSLDRLRAHYGRRELFPPGPLHGYHDPMRRAIFLPPGAPERVLRHEAVHLLVSESLAGTATLSPWLSEGLAQLFEGCDPVTAEVARPLDLVDRVEVDRLLVLQDYRRFTGAEAALNYGEALALTSFLYFGRPRETLRAYLAKERARESGRAEAFRSLYRHDEPPFARDLARFLAGGR